MLDLIEKVENYFFIWIKRKENLSFLCSYVEVSFHLGLQMTLHIFTVGAYNPKFKAF